MSQHTHIWFIAEKEVFRLCPRRIQKLASAAGCRIPSARYATEDDAAKAHAMLCLKVLGHLLPEQEAILSPDDAERLHAAPLEDVLLQVRQMGLQARKAMAQRRTGTYFGISYDKVESKYRAQLHWAGKHRSLGRFIKAEDAARAYDAAAYELRGRGAKLNFPEEHGLPPHGELLARTAAAPRVRRAERSAAATGAAAAQTSTLHSARPAPAAGPPAIAADGGTGSKQPPRTAEPKPVEGPARNAHAEDAVFCVSDSEDWTSDGDSDCDLEGVGADWDSPTAEEQEAQADWQAQLADVQEALVAAALEASGMTQPELRCRIAALDQQLEEDRKLNPYVAMLEQSMHDLINPDDMSEALLAAVSAPAPPQSPPPTQIFPEVLAEASEGSLHCNTSAGESVAALKSAMAYCAPADVAAQTTVDTPLVLNSLLAAAQGIPIAETLPKQKALPQDGARSAQQVPPEHDREDSPLTECLKELESELLADRRIPEGQPAAARTQAAKQLSLHDRHLQPRLLQAAMRSVIVQRFPHVKLPPPRKPLPIGPQRPLGFAEQASPGIPSGNIVPHNSSPTRPPTPATVAPSAAPILQPGANLSAAATPAPTTPFPTSHFEQDRQAAIAFLRPERFPTPTDSASRLFGSLPPPPTLDRNCRTPLLAPPTPAAATAAGTASAAQHTPQPLLPQSAMHVSAPPLASLAPSPSPSRTGADSDAPLTGHQPACLGERPASNALLEVESMDWEPTPAMAPPSGSVPTDSSCDPRLHKTPPHTAEVAATTPAATRKTATPYWASAATSPLLAHLRPLLAAKSTLPQLGRPTGGSSYGTAAANADSADGSRIGGSGEDRSTARRYLELEEPPGVPTLDAAPAAVKVGLAALARRQRERLLQRKPHLRAHSKAEPAEAPPGAGTPQHAAGRAARVESPSGLKVSQAQAAHTVGPPAGNTGPEPAGVGLLRVLPEDEEATEQHVTQHLTRQLKQMVLANAHLAQGAPVPVSVAGAGAPVATTGTQSTSKFPAGATMAQPSGGMASASTLPTGPTAMDAPAHPPLAWPPPDDQAHMRCCSTAALSSAAAAAAAAAPPAAANTQHSTAHTAEAGSIVFCAAAADGEPERRASRNIRKGGRTINVKPRNTRASTRLQSMHAATGATPRPPTTSASDKESSPPLASQHPPPPLHAESVPAAISQAPVSEDPARDADAPRGHKRRAATTTTMEPSSATGSAGGDDKGEGVIALRIDDTSSHSQGTACAAHAVRAEHAPPTSQVTATSPQATPSPCMHAQVPSAGAHSVAHAVRAVAADWHLQIPQSEDPQGHSRRYQCIQPIVSQVSAADKDTVSQLGPATTATVLERAQEIPAATPNARVPTLRTRGTRPPLPPKSRPPAARAAPTRTQPTQTRRAAAAAAAADAATSVPAAAFPLSPPQNRPAAAADPPTSAPLATTSPPPSSPPSTSTATQNPPLPAAASAAAPPAIPAAVPATPAPHRHRRVQPAPVDGSTSTAASTQHTSTQHTSTQHTRVPTSPQHDGIMHPPSSHISDSMGIRVTAPPEPISRSHHAHAAGAARLPLQRLCDAPEAAVGEGGSAAAREGDGLDGWEVLQSVMAAQGPLPLDSEWEALGDLLGFPTRSRFTEEWLEDAEGAHGPEFREHVAQRFQKLQRIMHEGESPVAEAIEPHSSEACIGFHNSVAEWVAQVRTAMDELERREFDDHMRRSTAHSALYGHELPPPCLPKMLRWDVDRNPAPRQVQPTQLSPEEQQSFQKVQEDIAAGRIDCMKAECLPASGRDA